jgi:nucleotide-binding universal stress UspA family protein
MALYSKILVTLDMSKADEPVIAHAIELAAVHRSTVTLLHVVHSHTLDQNRFMRIKAESYIEEKRSKFEQRKIEVRTTIRSGEPEKEVVAEVDSGAYDLVVLGTHGHTFFLDILLGSVTDTLKHRTNVPLLLITTD